MLECWKIRFEVLSGWRKAGKGKKDDSETGEIYTDRSFYIKAEKL